MAQIAGYYKAPTNLRGQTAPSADSVAIVAGELFEWDPTSTATSDDVDVVQVTGVTTGRWIRNTGQNVADKPKYGGKPLLFRTAIASGADGNVDITLGRKIRVIDAWCVLKGAGTAGSAVSVTDGTNVVVTAIDVSAGGDKDIFRAAEIDDAYHEIAAAGTLRWTKASTGGDFPGAEGYVLAVPVA